MATLEETRKSLERDEKQEKKSLSESLNLSDYSPGTSNFDSGMLITTELEIKYSSAGAEPSYDFNLSFSDKGSQK
jgi:hypothetical protein